MSLAAGSIIANRFELLSELGRGGMGTVWLAHHRALDARCAVKFMTLEAMRDASVVARFELEARTVAKLSSPNVVRVIDYDVHEGVPFIAMEYLDGEDLSLRLERVKRLSPAETYRVVSEVAKGLARAHAAGMVHRDLKPGNVFLAREVGHEVTNEGVREQDLEVVKLLDFGVVKFTGSDAIEGLSGATLAGTLLGTPAYMSPEQARGDAGVDHRADLWSLAVIAFECLTGKLPFESDSMGGMFAKILLDPLPVPSAVDPVCSPAFDRWWAKAAARDPEQRFDSAPEMAEALGRALGLIEMPDDPGRAPTLGAAPESHEAFDLSRRKTPSEPPPEAPRKTSRRPRLALLLAALVVAPLAVVMTTVRTDARLTRRPQAATIDAVEPTAARAPPPPAAPEGASAESSEEAVRLPALEAREIAPKERRPRAIAAPPTSRPVDGNAPKVRAPAEPPDDVDFGI